MRYILNRFLKSKAAFPEGVKAMKEIRRYRPAVQFLTGCLALLLLSVGLARAAGPYDLEFREADVKDVLRLLGDQEGINIIIGDGVKGTVTASFRGVGFEEILDSIMKMNDLRAVKDGSILRVESRLNMVGRGDTMVHRVFRLDYFKAEALAKTLAKSLSRDGSVTPDETTNSVLVNESQDRIDEVAALIKELDQPVPQIMIEARIVETTTTFAKELGVRWGFQYSRTSGGNVTKVFGTQADNSIVNVPAAPVVFGGAGFSFGRLDGSLNLDFQLTAMENRGVGKIISTPKIVTLDRAEATIQAGVKIPIQTVSEQQGVATTKIDYIDAFLKLTVTPQVTSQGQIVMKISAERTEPDWTRTVSDVPALQTREAQTQVRVRDGETVVIGGLLQENEKSVESRVPILADIPLIGGAFKRKEKTRDNGELLIFITPRIISP